MKSGKTAIGEWKRFKKGSVRNDRKYFVLINIMDRDKSAIDRARELIREGTPISITSISIFELYAGLEYSSRKTKEKEKILNVTESLTVLPFDKVSAIED